MRIGVRAHDYGRHDAEGLAELLSDAGYEAAQLAPAKCLTGVNRFDDVTEDHVSALKNAFEVWNIRPAVFGCYVDLSSSDDEVRGKAVMDFIRAMKLNRILGADVVATETSYEHFDRAGKIEHFRFMMDSLEKIADAAENLGTDFAIEPVDYYPLDDAFLTREVLDRLGSRHVKVIFDLMNVMKKPELYVQSEYWKESFELIGADIAAIHLKDYRVLPDGSISSCLLGEGVLDYTVLKQWLKAHHDMPVLREGMVPETASRDLDFMRRMQAET